jgi:hypothetical protein
MAQNAVLGEDRLGIGQVLRKSKNRAGKQDNGEA